MRTTLIAALCALIPALAHAQNEPCPRDHGYRMLVECQELEAEQWETKLTKLESVPMGDSLFEAALVQRVGVLVSHERWADALAACEEGIRMNGEYAYLFHMNKGVAMAGDGHYEEAIAYWQQANRTYPGSFAIPYIMATSAVEHKDHARVMPLLQDLVKRFPMDPRSHQLLAGVAENEDHPAQAAMALSMSLILSWGDPADEGRLVRLDKLLGGEIDVDPHGFDLGKEDDMTEIDLLLRNRVGMEKKYKVKPDLPYPTCRQSHLLFSHLAKENTGTGFWSTFYAPLFRTIMKENLFDGFVYHCLSSSTNEEVNEKARKNSAIVQKFRDRMEVYLLEHYQTFPDSTGAAAAQHFYGRNGSLYMVGVRHASQDRFDGLFTLYHPSGAISARGMLGEENKRMGPWVEYDANGLRSKTATYEKGDETGVVMTYFPDGTVKDSMTVVDGQLHGLFVTRTVPGAIRMTKTFDKGKANGPVKEYYLCGAVENEFTLVNELVEGTGTSYFADGVKEYSGEYVKGERAGVHTNWYHNGRKRSEFTFTGGKGNGPLKRWHYNGTLSEEGTQLNDKLVGVMRSYSPDSVLLREGNYDEGGRASGARRSFNEDGTLQMEEEYQRDLLVRYRFLDRKGNVLSEGERKKGKFQFAGFSPEGNKSVTGVYLDEGLKDGAWTYYYADGTVSSDENFNKGEQTGLQRSYDEIGRLKNQSNYTKDDRTGKYEQLYPSGKPEYIGWVEHGDLNGSYRHYMPDGTMTEDEYYVDGERSGWQRYFDGAGKLMSAERVENGTIRERRMYDQDGKEYQRIVIPAGRFTLEEKRPDGSPINSLELMNGVLHGKGVFYYPNGKVFSQGQYVNGKRHGVWTDLYLNGKKRAESTWELGELNGTRRNWYEDGTIWREEAFENGQTHGPFRNYDRRGKLVVQRERRYGTDHGEARSYNSNGELEITRIYDHDRLLSYAPTKADGTPGAFIDLPQAGIQDIKLNYANGQLARDMHLRNGEIDGPYREYYANGKLAEEATYSAGLIEGTSLEYHPNGKLESSTTYVHNMRHGPYKRYDANGKLVEEAEYRYDDAEGEERHYDSTGKLITTRVYRSGHMIAIR